MSSHKILLWLAVIFIFSFLLRLYFISLGPYHSDCLYLAIQSEKIVRTHQMHYLQSSGLPLTAVLGAGFVWLFQIFSIGDPVFAVNFMSIWFGSMCVVAMFFCVKQLTDARTGFLSAMLLSFNPLFFGLSVFGNSHMPAVFFLLTGTYYLLKYTESRRISHLVFAGLWLGCMGAARIQDFAVMSIPLLFLVLSLVNLIPDMRDRVKYIIVPFCSCLVVILIAYVPKFVLTNLPTGESSFSGYVQSNFTSHLQGMSPSVFKNIFRELLSIFSPVEWVLIVAGTVCLVRKKETPKFLFLLLWAIVPVVIYGFLKFFVFRFLIITLIPIIILESICAAFLSRLRFRLARFSIPFLFIFVLINLMAYFPTFAFRHQHALLPDFFQWINTVTEENAYIIERDHSIWISHYSKRTPFGPKKGLNHLLPEDLKEFKAELDNLLSRGDPVYITKYGLLDQKDQFRKFMLKNYHLEFIGGKMIEDWHLDCLKQVIVRNDLFKINEVPE